MDASVEVKSIGDDGLELGSWMDLDVGAELECWCIIWILNCFGKLVAKDGGGEIEGDVLMELIV